MDRDLSRYFPCPLHFERNHSQTLTLVIYQPPLPYPSILQSSLNPFVVALNHPTAIITTLVMGLNLDVVVAVIVFSTVVPSFLLVFGCYVVVIIAGLRFHQAPPSLTAVRMEETHRFRSMLSLSVKDLTPSTLRFVAASHRTLISNSGQHPPPPRVAVVHVFQSCVERMGLFSVFHLVLVTAVRGLQ
ncbi:unnamed protein product [Lactuca saligna]|uniref:Uncharacterized protein n=1 Tax=Lactuca saligna TaxID=75948 RepID=A0AA36E7R3_LACSI|nr:unnamed protein product [Lactuca saligna]